jgi:hypothetical protein
VPLSGPYRLGIQRKHTKKLVLFTEDHHLLLWYRGVLSRSRSTPCRSIGPIASGSTLLVQLQWHPQEKSLCRLEDTRSAVR